MVVAPATVCSSGSTICTLLSTVIWDALVQVAFLVILCFLHNWLFCLSTFYVFFYI